MKALYVTGACLTKNTSANMSHNALIKGLIQNGYTVDIIMSDDSWGETDQRLSRFKDANYYEFSAVSFADRLRKKTRMVIPPNQEGTNSSNSVKPKKRDIKQNVRAIAKAVFYKIDRKDPIYKNETKWLKTARRFHSKEKYDLVISNSSPAASHKLVQILSEKKNISFKRWIQVWEDPWYYDLYGGSPKAVKKEEHSLLKSAEEIYYVSPLTLMYQKHYFADCAHKMKYIPLPFLDFSKQSKDQAVRGSYGYFGDYYSVTRNITPFYEALLKSGNTGHIIGDSDIHLKGNEKIEISGRVTLDALEIIQAKTDILVHLSNLRGGQIPGKIYHYSATNKPVLFILDGTENEKKSLIEYFGKYNRFYFCENETDAILSAMKRIETDNRRFEPVKEFSPKNVVKMILN